MWETQKLKIMKEMKNEIQMLQYRIKRYHDMRNGAMCQALNGKLQKLLAIKEKHLLTHFDKSRILHLSNILLNIRKILYSDFRLRRKICQIPILFLLI